MGLSKRDQTNKITSNIHKKLIDLFHLYIILKYGTFAHF